MVRPETLEINSCLLRNSALDSKRINQVEDLMGMETEIRSAVDVIASLFLAPLEAKGMNAVSAQDEIEEAVDYARKYLSLATKIYRRIRYKLHTCPNSGRWPNILLLCELVSIQLTIHYVSW